ncbi:hypothetical protein CH260_04835 [Rhodococcus sp. 05-2256-B2]|uniref:multiubiquitin domain-containing protein n=1 Tax=unclassified Rhodococcus (in: high G+C Gram-positive bacteria) TaxID=192944 RepID=UPI000B9BD14F|nr:MULTISPECIES: multiubiquitin domain-containing protein [unclassified Rhodococcus (in: high G+C Gram-positive bacteria)]OZD85354.1 hypothetical protein CH258_14185 [Rhodococcus sp. 05-2256-B4]OZD99274.1 hypothetical protein CH257_00445 [Rhodococcus sp. 05-2256-B3]OZE00652.1 hypothetical protein CH260_04835 [Rhodococcus sp. 05-2256-B2]OZE02798.1 hypothetical protein CH285_12560 [Rhodococcus sp. 05-2256-B1]
MTTLNIEIDDNSYSTTDDDQESASLLRLAGRDAGRYDLFVIDAHGVETRIEDDQIVNLHSDMRFRTRQKVRFTIASKPFSSFDDDQTAGDLIRLAGLEPAEHDLTRVSPNGQRETFADEQLVKITDGDKFVTVVRNRELTIIVNTRPHLWREKRINYTQVVEIAYPGQPVTDQEDVTVHYTPRRGGGATLTAGHDVEVTEGMVFDVHRTTRS